MIEYYNNQPKLYKQVILSSDHKTGTYENITYLHDFQTRKRLCVIKDYGLKTKENFIINGCTSYVKCYENFFVVCKRAQVMTISEQNISHSFKVYDYEGNVLDSAPYCWNEEKHLAKYEGINQDREI